MKIITLTLHIDVEEAQTIISFIDELKTVLLANYGEEIQENHRMHLKLDTQKEDENDF